jgi:hypothetical protein
MLFIIFRGKLIIELSLCQRRNNMLILFEIIAGLLGGIGQDNSLNTKKIDKHIEELRSYKWFNEIYEDEKYNRLFFVNRRVRKLLQSRYLTRRMINNLKAQNKFKAFLNKQLNK